MLIRKAPLLLMMTVAFPASLTGQSAPPCSQAIFSAVRSLEGSWNIQSRARLSASPDDWESGVGTATIQQAMRGCLLIEQYAGSRRGQPFEAVRVFAVTADGKGLRLALADSEHGPLFIFDGAPEPDGIAFYTEVTTPRGKVRLRVRIRDIAKDSFVTESQRSVDEGKTWDTTGRAEYRRRSG